MVTCEINQVTIKPGQTLTVWLDRAGSSTARDAAQVELRVRPDGRREIFCRPNGEISIRDFDDWEAI